MKNQINELRAKREVYAKSCLNGKSINEYLKTSYRVKINKPNKVVKFFHDNKDLIFLESIRPSTQNISNAIFYELYDKLVFSTDKFDLTPTGYYSGFLVTYRGALSIKAGLREFGIPSEDEKNFLWFDLKDYDNYIKYELDRKQIKLLRLKECHESNHIEKKYFKSNYAIPETEYDCNIVKFKKINENRNNPSEMKMKSILDSLNIRYEYQKIIITNFKSYILDFYLPDNNIAIEVDGEYHNDFDSIKKDFERDRSLARYGLLTARFENKELDNETNIIIALSNLIKNVNN